LTNLIEVDFSIHARELLKIINHRNTIIIDIREPYELEESSIDIAKNIPMYTLLNNFQSVLDKAKIYYIICHTGRRSLYVTEILIKSGYKAINVFGGIALLPEFYHQ